MKLTVATVSLALMVLSGAAANAQTGRLLTVRGEAEVEVPPDFVQLEVLIAADDEDVDEAKSDVDARTRRAIEAIESFAIAEEDLSFSGLRVDRNYEYDRNDNERLIGYSVGRTIEIKLRKFEHYEQLIHMLVEAGIDELEDVRSGVDDKYALERAALEGAAKAAKLKAEAMASGLGIRLGMPVEVGEDRLMPSLTLRQQMAEGEVLEEVVVTGSRRGIVDPMLFVPANIKVRGVAWVRFEMLNE